MYIIYLQPNVSYVSVLSFSPVWTILWTPTLCSLILLACPFLQSNVVNPMDCRKGQTHRIRLRVHSIVPLILHGTVGWGRLMGMDCIEGT